MVQPHSSIGHRAAGREAASAVEETIERWRGGIDPGQLGDGSEGTIGRDERFESPVEGHGGK
jgi:hypothetical protein